MYVCMYVSVYAYMHITEKYLAKKQTYLLLNAVKNLLFDRFI